MSLLVLLALAAPPDAVPADADRPNVVVIWSDDLSAYALGCYPIGDRTEAGRRTPNIDRLATRSVVFDRAYCAFPVCGPTRLATMAGMDPQSLGVMGNYEDVAVTNDALADRPSLSQAFAADGYRTMRSGKIYHMRVPGDITAGVAGPDHTPSWDETYNAHAPEWMTEGEHEHPGKTTLRFDRDKHYRLGFGGAFYIVEGESDGGEQADSLIADHAVRMIRENAKRPFFLGVGFVRPHVPLVAPAGEFADIDAKSLGLPATVAGDHKGLPRMFHGATSTSLGLDDDTEKRRVLQAYFAATSFMDAQVGRVLAAIDEAGLTERTIVVFLSDHGYHLGEHDYWQKFSIYEESVRIPMMVAGPGISPRRTDALASQLDLYPTLCELAGIDRPPHLQGVSLVPVLGGSSDSVQDAVTSVCGRRGRMLRTDRWAYLRGAGGEALFDMASDPGQHKDVKGSQPQALEAMRSRMDALLDDRGIGIE